MSDQLPIPRPDYEYVSHGPYTVSWEWSRRPEFHIEEHIVHASTDDLGFAIQMFWEPSAPFGEHWSPDRRVLFDARGITVLGAHDCPPSIILTREVVTQMEAAGLTKNVDPFDVIEWGLAMQWPS